MCVCACVYKDVCLCMCMYMSVCMCGCVCLCVYMYVSIYPCILSSLLLAFDFVTTTIITNSLCIQKLFDKLRF